MKKVFIIFLKIAIVKITVAQSTGVFIENKGQWPKEVLFETIFSGGAMRLQKNGFRYVFHQRDTSENHHGAPIIKSHAIATEFIGCNQNSVITAEQNVPTLYNYFLGKTYATKCRGFKKVTYHNFYPNIDLTVFYQGDKIKYEFIMTENADPSIIRWKYDGAEKTEIKEGKIHIKNSITDFQEDIPVVLGSPTEISYKNEDNIFSFNVDKQNQTWIIDPTLVFSTFSGAASDNWGNTATYGEKGRFYSAGTVEGSQFPATNGAYDRTLNKSSTDSVDIGILKFDSAGKTLLYATFLGGTSTEMPHSLIVNNKNELIILGTTSSKDFPITKTAYDTSFNGGRNVTPIGGRTFVNGSDIFLSILSEDGSTLVASTYFGGSGNDGLNYSDSTSQNINNRNYGDEFRGEIVVDDLNQIYIASVTQSKDFPVSNKAPQKYIKGGQDAVLASFSEDLKTLRWSTYWGGSNRDAAFSLKIASDKTIYITGGTASTDFFTTSGALHKDYRGGTTDGFITRFNQNADTVLASTFLGTNKYDQAFFIDIDSDSGQIVVFGQSLGDYPVTQGVYNNPDAKQFLHALNKTLSRTIWSTTFGTPFAATINIVPTAFLVNECSKIYVAGWGSSNINTIANYYLGGNTFGMPVTQNAFQRNTDGEDFYLAVFDKNVSRLLYGTYIGGDTGQGDHVDGGTCRFDKNGTVYHAVCSCGGRRNNFPTTSGAFSRNATSYNCTIASFKFDMNNVIAQFKKSATDSLKNGKGGCVPYTINFEDKSIGGEKFFWDFGDGTRKTFNRRTNVSHTYNKAGIYFVSLSVVDSVTCKIVSNFRDTITVFPSGFNFPKDTLICQGQNLRLSGISADTVLVGYLWNPGKGLSDSTIANPVFFGDTTTRYLLTLTNIFGCKKTDTVVINVNPQPQASFEWEQISDCSNITKIKLRNTSKNSNFFLWNTGLGSPDTTKNPLPLDFKKPGIYPVGLFAFNGNCSDFQLKNVVVSPDTFANFIKRIHISKDTTICQGDTIKLSVSGGVSYRWFPSEGLNDSTSESPLAFPTKTTRYRVKIFGPQNICSTDTNVLISVIENLKTNYELNYRYACGVLPTAVLKDKLNNAQSYRLEISDGRVINGLPDFISFSDTGEYTIAVKATGFGCEDEQRFKVRILNHTPANVFTPNGDGKNEVFFVSKESLPVKIFDRWGRKILDSGSYQNDWKAEGLDDTVFYYEIILPDGQICRGWVLVLR